MMSIKIQYTLHEVQKFKVLSQQGWKFSKRKVNKTIREPIWIGKSRYGQETAMSLLNERHILRVIFNRKSDKIIIVTFHPARIGEYESTVQS